MATFYAGGGGGSSEETTSNGAGGNGGGGAGGGHPNAGVAGTANTGGGGGGSNQTQTSGAGGSGVVIVKEAASASGIWSMSEQLESVDDGTWPAIQATIDYLVVAGGGGSGSAACGYASGGGGAGGYRASGYGPSPLQGSSLTLSDGDYVVTVGAGGAAGS